MVTLFQNLLRHIRLLLFSRLVIKLNKNKIKIQGDYKYPSSCCFHWNKETGKWESEGKYLILKPNAKLWFNNKLFYTCPQDREAEVIIKLVENKVE